MEHPTRPRILPLSGDVISKIHSSRHITSLHDAVVALVENSLDAGSSRVEATVDWSRGGCVVEDNGSGIAHKEFRGDGNLCRMYCTSKHHTTTRLEATHGKNGTFLAELASLSMLDITSREPGSGITAVIVLHHGSVISRQFQEVQSDEAIFAPSGSQHGTRVTVRDLFGNMPVRVKQRASAKAEEQAAWYDLKLQILALLLAWREPCTIKIRDACSGSRIASLAMHSPTTATELTTKNLRRLSGNIQPFDIRDRLSLLFQAGFAAVETRKQWVPVSASTSSLSLQGLLCLEPAPTRQCQFISIGIHPCSRSTGHFELYEAVNRMIDHSDFGRAEHVGPELHGKDSGVARTSQPQSRKKVDRFAMFCIQLAFTDDALYKPSTTGLTSDALIAAIMDVLEASIWSWLEQNLFRPTKRRRPQNSLDAASIKPHQLSTADTAVRSSLVSGLGRSTTKHKGGLDSEGPWLQNEDLPHTPHDHGGGIDPRSSIRMGSASKTSPSFPLVVGRKRDNSSDKAQVKRVFRNSIDENDVEGTKFVRRSQDRPIIQVHGLGRETSPRRNFRWNVPRDVAARGSTAEPDHRSAAESSADDVVNYQIFSDEYGSIDEASMIAATEATESRHFLKELSPGQSKCGDWKDPVSGQIYKLDLRTGNVTQIETVVSQPDTIRHGEFSRKNTAIETKPPCPDRPLRLVGRQISQYDRGELDREQAGERWLPNFLRTWKNPTFNLQTEESIPATSFGGISSLQPRSFADEASGGGYSHITSLSTIEKSNTQLSKTAFRAAEVINQVDGKFILCKMADAGTGNVHQTRHEAVQTTHEEIIIIVDQHAASERVIVEQLFGEFWGAISAAAADNSVASQHTTRIGTTELTHLQFEVSAKEHELLSIHHAHFYTWGIQYRLFDLAKHQTDEKLKRARQELRLVIETLPSVIAERCSNFPRLCIDMMRSEIWALSDGSKKPLSQAQLRAYSADADEQTSVRDSSFWVRCMSACPQGIIDMINSRACRSAIMFNDVLSPNDCQSLVRDLGACAFPFTCAHGRASVVPLMSLNDQMSWDPPGSGSKSAVKTYQDYGDGSALTKTLGHWMRDNDRAGPMQR